MRGGRGGSAEGLERPECAVFLGNESVGDLCGFWPGGWRSGGDPAFDELDFRFGHGFAFSGHIAFTDEPDQFAFVRFAGNDGDGVFGAVWLGEKTPQAHVEIPFSDAVLPVAMDATMAEDGSDIGFENRNASVFGVRTGCEEKGEAGRDRGEGVAHGRRGCRMLAMAAS